MDFNNIGSSEEALFTSKVNEIKADCTGDNKKILISHVGEIEQTMVDDLSSMAETQLMSMEVPKAAVKKIFNIVIETLQNICIHGEKDKHGFQMTYFFMGKNNNEFTMYSGNIVNKANVEKLTTRLNHLKGLADPELKQEYMEVLSNGELSTKGGAGLGFITIALKSGNNMGYSFTELNSNFSLFSLYSKVIA